VSDCQVLDCHAISLDIHTVPQFELTIENDLVSVPPSKGNLWRGHLDCFLVGARADQHEITLFGRIDASLHCRVVAGHLYRVEGAACRDSWETS